MWYSAYARSAPVCCIRALDYCLGVGVSCEGNSDARGLSRIHAIWASRLQLPAVILLLSTHGS